MVRADLLLAARPGFDADSASRATTRCNAARGVDVPLIAGIKDFIGTKHLSGNPNSSIDVTSVWKDCWTTSSGWQVNAAACTAPLV